MNKVMFFHLAQTAILEKGTDNLSMINLIDGFNGVSFPFLAPPFSIVLRTERDVKTDPDKIEVEVIIKQKGGDLFKGKFSVDYQGKRRHHLVISIQGLVIPGHSPLEVICMYDGKEIGKVELEIQNITLQAEKKG